MCKIFVLCFLSFLLDCCSCKLQWCVVWVCVCVLISVESTQEDKGLCITQWTMVLSEWRHIYICLAPDDCVVIIMSFWSVKLMNWLHYVFFVLKSFRSTKRFGPDKLRFEHLAFLNLAQSVVCLMWSFISKFLSIWWYSLSLSCCSTCLSPLEWFGMLRFK